MPPVLIAQSLIMSTMSELHLLGNCRKTKRYSWGTCSYDLEHNSHEQEISLGSAKNNTLEKIFKNVIFELDFAKELKNTTPYGTTR